VTATLPARPHIEHLKKQAKNLLRDHRDGDLRLGPTLREYLPRLAQQTDAEALAAKITLHDAQYVVALQHGFDNWAALREAVEAKGKPKPEKPVTPKFDQLDERMRRHLEALGFSTVGGYRVWCHRQKLANGLDKSDAQLVEEREAARQLGGKLEPQVSHTYRRGQADSIEEAFRGTEDPEKADNWVVLLFAITTDEEERQALRQLLLHLEKYSRIPVEASARLASHYRQWRQPVDRFFPTSPNRAGELVELTRYLLGHENILTSRNLALDEAVEAAAWARAEQGAEKYRELSEDQVKSFHEKGYLRLPKAFPPEAALEMQDFMWSELKRLHGFEREDASTWKMPGKDRFKPKLNDTSDNEVYNPMASAKLLGAIGHLCGERAVSGKQSWGGFGVTFPDNTADQWHLRDGDWHLDFGTFRPDRLTQVPLSPRHFTFFSHVEPRGGGTLVVEGSHRLALDFCKKLGPLEKDRKKSVVEDRFARSHPWLAELAGKVPSQGDRVRRFMEEGAVIDGVPVRVVEMTGAPGDAILWHPALYHGRSSNCSAVPRFMRT
jgi:hypothetical protein